MAKHGLAQGGPGNVVPLEVRQVEGSVKDAKVGPRPKTKRGIDRRRSRMSRGETAIFREILRDVDWLTQSSDGVLVEHLAHVLCEWRKARDHVAKHGPYDQLEDGRMVESAAAQREHRLGDKLTKLLPKLGMTPADAHRVAPPADKRKDPLDDILD